MWSSIILALLLHNVYCQGVYLYRCCRPKEDVYVSKIDNKVTCAKNPNKFKPIIYSERLGCSNISVPVYWQILDSAIPRCSATHELKFIKYEETNLYRLYETGILTLYIASSEENIDQYKFCLANNGLLTCQLKSKSIEPRLISPLMQIRKCCGENGYFMKSKCEKNESQNLTMQQDLNDLLKIGDKRYPANYTNIIKGFPKNCSAVNFTSNIGKSFKIESDFSMTLDGGYVIPANEYCIERNKTSETDEISVIRCSKYTDSYNSSEAVETNIYILLLYTCLHYVIRKLF